MLVFLNTRAHQNTVRGFLRSFGRALAGTVVVRSYERMLAEARLPPALYVFGDLERLTPDQAERAAALWRRLDARRDCRLLNHPTRSMCRYELLRTLHERGRNRFDVYRASEARAPRRFPVFLRGEHDHDGSRTPLLADAAALAAALAELERGGARRDDVLVTEFCDTAGADGIYRKYAAFTIAGHIVPRHLFYGDEWMIKTTKREDPHLLAEEREYLKTNPHAAALAAVFALARIDYGRIDYALLDGEPQVWEINTNPMTVSFRHAGGAARQGVQAAFAERFAAALRALGPAAGTGR